MSEVTIYHNPRCSKSRQTLALIEQQGVTPKIIEYLNTPLDVETLMSLANMLSAAPREMMRTKEAPYTDNKLSTASDAELFNAIVKNPILLERPIVVKKAQAVIGRPPENVLQLLR